jgi:flagellar biosynthesis/type III secretory pathway protein FliH
MPLLDDIRDNRVLGREYKRGFEQGYREGFEQGYREGALRILRREIEKRFGAIPSWAEAQLAARSTAELVELIDRVLDAPTLEDLLNSQPPPAGRP